MIIQMKKGGVKLEEILKLKNKSGNIVNARYKILNLNNIDEIIQMK